VSNQNTANRSENQNLNYNFDPSIDSRSFFRNTVEVNYNQYQTSVNFYNTHAQTNHFSSNNQRQNNNISTNITQNYEVDSAYHTTRFINNPSILNNTPVVALTYQTNELDSAYQTTVTTNNLLNAQNEYRFSLNQTNSVMNINQRDVIFFVYF